jgi:hypothetical protein
MSGHPVGWEVNSRLSEKGAQNAQYLAGFASAGLDERKKTVAVFVSLGLIFPSYN